MLASWGAYRVEMTPPALTAGLAVLESITDCEERQSDSQDLEPHKLWIDNDLQALYDGWISSAELKSAVEVWSLE